MTHSKKIVLNVLEKIILWMLIFIPISVYFSFFTDNQTMAFISSILAILPLATIIGYCTKEIVLQSNPTIGGLVNATFGNIIELMIAIIALSEGLVIVVQASIIGSILGNLLLLTGLSILFGGLKYKEQQFNKNSVGVSSTMLIIAVAGLAIPTVYSLTSHADPTEIVILGNAVAISNAISIVLALTYIAGLSFSLFTHKHLFDSSDEIQATKEKPTLSKKTAFIILLIAVLFVALESELLVNTIKHAVTSLGMTETFIGVILIAILTNVAEKSTAIHFALKNDIDTALEIGLSSAIQIALFVVPILVFISAIFNYGFSLVFTLFEILSMLLAVMIINYLSGDGRCNWLEGVQLISLYLIIAIAFYFI
jgi:Ca2+:H+ antiporter